MSRPGKTGREFGKFKLSFRSIITGIFSHVSAVYSQHFERDYFYSAGVLYRGQRGSPGSGVFPRPGAVLASVWFTRADLGLSPIFFPTFLNRFHISTIGI